MGTSESDTEVPPNGSAWAGILAAGIGCAVLGLLIDLAEASKLVSNALNFYNPTGDLSGKTIVAVAVWLIAWTLLHLRWRHQSIRSPKAVMVVTLILIVLALVAVFPPFFGMFAAD